MPFLETFHKEITKIMLIYNDEISIIIIALDTSGVSLWKKNHGSGDV